jgi:hypothetical protein
MEEEGGLWDLGDYDSAGGHLVFGMAEPGVQLHLLDPHALCGVLFQHLLQQV